MEYGPIEFLIGQWESEGWSGENKAPDPDRKEENTRFRQIMEFIPIGLVENHEQALWVLRYSTAAWEKDGDENPFHQEVGYFIWDNENKQLLKSFIVPRGIAVNAGGTVDDSESSFTLSAQLENPVHGISSNPFLDKEFRTLQYNITFQKLDSNTFTYNENTLIQIKGRESVFEHTEKNVMKRVK
ncbi:MAG: FABP family protein [Bacteroidales bacterium]|nr:FABP family protein [Bacteroidales bacterium]